MGRIAFLGTGPFGVPLLARLADMADTLLVVSQPDRPAGRGLQSRPSAVAAWAREHGLPVALTVLPGRHHYSILDELAQPGGAIARALVQLIGNL